MERRTYMCHDKKLNYFMVCLNSDLNHDGLFKLFDTSLTIETGNGSFSLTGSDLAKVGLTFNPQQTATKVT